MNRASYFRTGKSTIELNQTTSEPTSDRQVRSAWENFVTANRPAEAASGHVRDDILASWQRSMDLGVDAGISGSRKVSDEEQLARRRGRNVPLRKAASAAFKRLEPHLREARSILLLADEQGVIIDAIGDASVLDDGQDIHLEIGGQWSESTVGTNGIGTALKTGKPIYVHGAEHFVQGVQMWTCAGAPIRNPLDNSVMGVVDLSGPPDIFRKHNIALVLAAAREIEIALAEQQRTERTQLLEAFLESKHSYTDEAVLLLDRSGRILFRRAFDEKAFPPSSALSIGNKLLPEIEAFADKDLPRFLPPNVEAQGLERLIIDNRYRGAALFLKCDSKPARPATETRKIRPREGVTDELVQIVGSSPRILEAIELAERAAQANISVLVQGETGVGKELFARLIHSRLNRADAPYVPVNCAAISNDLIGAELFGYVEGAFTGAVRGGRTGKFEQADGGVLCLDEIGDMPVDLQPYFLRALEQRAIYRMGDNKRRPVNVRLVAMTNRDLRQEIDRGNFRRDLFYRISMVTIDVPPLRERGSDVAALLDYFSAHFAGETGQPLKTFGADVMDRLMRYRWPGNVRELRNLVQRAYLFTSGSQVSLRDLPSELRDMAETRDAAPGPGLPGANQGYLESIEASAIRKTIADEKGNLTRVAAILGISRPTLYRKMRHYGIDWK